METDFSKLTKKYSLIQALATTMKMVDLFLENSNLTGILHVETLWEDNNK